MGVGPQEPPRGYAWLWHCSRITHDAYLVEPAPPRHKARRILQRDTLPLADIRLNDIRIVIARPLRRRRPRVCVDPVELGIVPGDARAEVVVDEGLRVLREEVGVALGGGGVDDAVEGGEAGALLEVGLGLDEEEFVPVAAGDDVGVGVHVGYSFDKVLRVGGGLASGRVVRCDGLK